MEKKKSVKKAILSKEKKRVSAVSHFKRANLSNFSLQVMLYFFSDLLNFFYLYKTRKGEP